MAIHCEDIARHGEYSLTLCGLPVVDPTSFRPLPCWTPEKFKNALDGKTWARGRVPKRALCIDCSRKCKRGKG